MLLKYCLKITDYKYKNLDCNKNVIGTFIDIKKAFDSVDHSFNFIKKIRIF